MGAMAQIEADPQDARPEPEPERRSARARWALTAGRLVFLLLAVGVLFKVSSDALPADLKQAIAAGKVNLDDPATTLALLKLKAVVGVSGFFNSNGSLASVGITCAVCHSTVDNSFAPGIGRRLDGWPNRDLNVGAIVAAAPNH